MRRNHPVALNKITDWRRDDYGNYWTVVAGATVITGTTV